MCSRIHNNSTIICKEAIFQIFYKCVTSTCHVQKQCPAKTQAVFVVKATDSEPQAVDGCILEMLNKSSVFTSEKLSTSWLNVCRMLAVFSMFLEGVYEM